MIPQTGQGDGSVCVWLVEAEGLVLVGMGLRGLGEQVVGFRFKVLSFSLLNESPKGLS